MASAKKRLICENKVELAIAKINEQIEDLEVKIDDLLEKEKIRQTYHIVLSSV